MNPQNLPIDIGAIVELDGALCAKVGDPGDWFPEPTQPEVALAAKAVCGLCPVKVRCLKLALEMEGSARGGRYGIYGGLTATERGELVKGGPKKPRKESACIPPSVPRPRDLRVEFTEAERLALHARHNAGEHSEEICRGEREYHRLRVRTSRSRRKAADGDAA